MAAVLVGAVVSLVSGFAVLSQGFGGKQTPSDTYLDALIERDGFINGVLIPWFDSASYGHDIGGNYREGYTVCGFNEDTVRSVLWNNKILGFNMVKIWLSEVMEGIVFDKEGHVLGVDETYLMNLERIFDIAEEYDLNLALTLVPHMSNNAADSEEYNRCTRFIQNPAITQEYLENWLKPVLTLARKYPNIMLIDIYGEPEGDVDESNWHLDRGTTWEGMIRFINTVAAYVKESDPRLAVTVSSGDYYKSLTQYHNQMDVDFIGCDIYNDTGELTDPKELKLTAPLMLGEYGMTSNGQLSDVYLTELSRDFVTNAEELGYAGIFLWNAPGHTEEGLALYSEDGSLRLQSSYFRFRALDKEKEISGSTGLDQPAMIATVDTEFISWFGSRDAESYLLERSEDGKGWTAIDTISASLSGYEYNPYMFKYVDKTAEMGVSYYYRVTAIRGEEKAVSERAPLFKQKKIRCTAEENALKDYSFESGTIGEPWQDGVKAGLYTLEKGQAHDGQYSLHFHNDGDATWGALLQEVELKPHTEYVFTVYYKGIQAGSNGEALVNVLENGNHQGTPLKLDFSNEWNYATKTFTTGGEEVSYSVYIPECSGEYYIDDIYLFQKNA